MLDRFRFVGDFSCRLNPLRVTTRQEGVISWISLLRTHQSLSVWVASTAIGRHIKLSIVSVPIFVGVCGRVDLFVHWGHIFCLQSLEGIIAGRPLRRFTLGGRVGQIVAERVLTARLARMRPSWRVDNVPKFGLDFLHLLLMKLGNLVLGLSRVFKSCQGHLWFGDRDAAFGADIFGFGSKSSPLFGHRWISLLILTKLLLSHLFRSLGEGNLGDAQAFRLLEACG